MSEDNIVPIGRGEPRIVGDGVVISPEGVLDGARGLLRQVVVLGIDLEGDLYVAGTHGAPETVILIEIAKQQVLRGYRGETS